MWDWYFNLSESLRRVRDGVCERIPPSEYIAWKQATGNIVYVDEYAILQAMDAAYCSKMNEELSDYRIRRDEQAAKDANKPRGMFGFGRKR